MSSHLSVSVFVLALDAIDAVSTINDSLSLESDQNIKSPLSELSDAASLNNWTESHSFSSFQFNPNIENVSEVSPNCDITVEILGECFICRQQVNDTKRALLCRNECRAIHHNECYAKWKRQNRQSRRIHNHSKADIVHAPHASE